MRQKMVTYLMDASNEQSDFNTNLNLITLNMKSNFKYLQVSSTSTQNNKTSPEKKNKTSDITKS